MRVADYVADFVFRQGTRHVFMVSGGGMMFLSDGVACHPKLSAICNHHEQASAMAAAALAKYSGDLGVAYLTTGCGGTNALTGVLNAWQDNTACLFISGQCKTRETIQGSGLRLRQFGVQEADIVSIVSSITKYSAMVRDASQVAFQLEKAAFLARTGRPGPVWLDIPMDVQSADIDPDGVPHFDNIAAAAFTGKTGITGDELALIRQSLAAAHRPIVLAGQGVRLARATEAFKQFIETNQVPFVVSRLGIDCLPSNHPLYIGRIGTKGDRAGNFAIQNADLVLVLGSRLSVSSTGHEYSKFAREAKTIVVDIDPAEHQKRTVRIDHLIVGDVRQCLEALNQDLSSPPPDRGSWLVKCSDWKARWPVCLPEYAAEGPVNLYYFVNRLSALMATDAVVISDAGSAFYACSQGLQLREQQRYVTSGGQAEMGFSLPAAIGISMARNKGEVIGVTGDGSFQMNVQELQTVVHHQLPVKLFVWNNDGYLSIRSTQSRFFEGRLIGTDSTSGVSFPSLERLAAAYGVPFIRINASSEVESGIRQVLQQAGPVLCEVMCLRDQEIVPAVSTAKLADGRLVSKPLEDMYPFLSRDEFNENMMVAPLPESRA